MQEFEPVAWTAPKGPGLEGPYAENSRLAEATLWDTGGIGPEDVVVDRRGDVHTGIADGSILRFGSTGGSPTKIADVGGRPLGIELLDDGELLVCNADLGLQRVTANGEVTLLLDRIEGAPLVLTNNAAVAGDGTIYFTESTVRWSLHEYVNDLLEGQPTGRLFALTTDGTVSVLADQLQFANGVALDAAEQSVFVAETGRYRIHRHWLDGEHAGTTEIFMDNLPGFPDNLSYSDGVLWAAMASPRQATVDFMAPRRWLRHLSYRLPDNLKPKPVRHGIVLGIADDGTVIYNLQDASGTVAITTSVRHDDGRLFIGTLTDPTVAVFQL